MTTFLPDTDSEQSRAGTRDAPRAGWYRRLMLEGPGAGYLAHSSALSAPATNADTGSSGPIQHDLPTARRAAAKLAAKGLAEPPLDRVVGRQKWLATVAAVYDDIVELELESDDGGPGLVADFPLELFAEDEPMPGDVAYVTVRTVKGWRGQPSRTVSARLRRVGRWTQEELGEIRAATSLESEELNALFD